MISRLTDTLARVGRPASLWTSPDGSRVLVLPYGGRILGLFTALSDRNFFWTNPALDNSETAEAYYHGPQWHNSGGERTWLSPEVEFFLPDYPSLKTYFQPREFDPGSYELESRRDEWILRNSFTARMARSKSTVRLRINKGIAPAKDPLTNAEANLSSSLQYAGFTLRTGLEILENTASAQLNLWSLLQLPHGGTMILPTYGHAQVIHFMGSISSDDLQVSNSIVRYKMHDAGEHKIGVPALFATGRIGYLLLNGDASTLVVRNIIINPSAKYLDTPWTAQDSVGAAIEVCSVNSDLGAFSELEHHAPAIGGAGGNTECEDISQVWAYRGSEDAIRSAARILLHPSL